MNKDLQIRMAQAYNLAFAEITTRQSYTLKDIEERTLEIFDSISKLQDLLNKA